MAAFEDRTGQTWSFEIDFPSLRRVLRRLDVDLVAMTVPELLTWLSSPIRLIDALYCLCEPDIQRLGLTDEEFGKRCVISLEPVVAKIVEGITAFFLELGKPQQAQILLKTWTMTTMMDSALTEEVIGSVFDQMERLIRQRIAENASGEKSTETQPTLAGSVLNSPG